VILVVQDRRIRLLEGKLSVLQQQQQEQQQQQGEAVSSSSRAAVLEKRCVQLQQQVYEMEVGEGV